MKTPTRVDLKNRFLYSVGWLRSPTEYKSSIFEMVLNHVVLLARLLVATHRHRRQHPLTSQALRSAVQGISISVQFQECESYLVVTHAQIEYFLQNGWDYTERRLRLLQQVCDFPISPAGVGQLAELRQRMEGIRGGDFNQVVDEIYRDPIYPIFQHVGQAFRNQVTRRYPFVLDSIISGCPAPHRLLDVGCGSGILLADLLEAFPSAEGIGVDISPTILQHTQHVFGACGLARRTTLLNADLRNPPFSEETFDAVVATEVLEHIPEPLAGLCELRRVLTSQGILVTSLPVQDRTPVHLHEFGSVDDVVGMHTAAGLFIQRMEVVEVAPGVPDVLIAARKEA